MKYWEIGESGEVLVGEEIDGGGWYIEMPERDNPFNLFEVPLYGGSPSFVDCFATFELAHDAAKKLT